MNYFTDKFVGNLKPENKTIDVRESNGFGIRVLPSGVKTWFFIYRIDGKRRFMNLGHYPAVSLSDARRKYRKAFNLYEQGKDPAAVEDQAREERRKAPTVEELCSGYIERHARRFKKSWAKDEQILNRDVVPAWGKRKAADIAKRDVILLLEGIVNRGAPGMANNTFQIIRKMFNYAVEKDILQHTPCSGVKLPSPKLARERTLSEDEIKTLWKSLDRTDLNMGLDSKRALRLILVTAQRPGEVIGMHTSEIDGEWWTIPSERAKNGKTHRVYLAGLAREIIGEAIDQVKKLRKIPAEAEYRGFIFPCPHKDKDKPLGDTALAVAVGRNLAYPLTDMKGKPLYGADGELATENRLEVDKFTPHDLRRTAATFMAAAGEMDEVIDAVLNHAKQGVIKVYNQYRYDREKQIALEAWERKLKSIVTGKPSGKVVPIKKAISE
jgi:integrase